MGDCWLKDPFCAVAQLLHIDLLPINFLSVFFSSFTIWIWIVGKETRCKVNDFLSYISVFVFVIVFVFVSLYVFVFEFVFVFVCVFVWEQWLGWHYLLVDIICWLILLFVWYYFFVDITFCLTLLFGFHYFLVDITFWLTLLFA